MKISNMIWENIKIKRKVAALLCLVMTVQMVLSGTLPAMAEGTASDPAKTWEHFDLIGKPKEAFETVQASVEKKVTDNQTVALRFSMELKDSYTAKIYEDAIDKKVLLSAAEFEPSAEFANYDDYLNQQEDSVLPSISFSCVLDGGDALLLTGALEGKMDTGEQGIVGSYKLEKEKEKGKIVFHANVDKRVYALWAVSAGQNIEIDANTIYTPGSEITATPGDGDSDIKITINPNENPDPDDQNYIATKSSAMQKNSREIIYTIRIVASNSDATYVEELPEESSFLDYSEDDSVEVASPSISRFHKVMRKSTVLTADTYLTGNLLGLNKIWAVEAAKAKTTKTEAIEVETTETETTEAETTEAETTEAETTEVETTEVETSEVETTEKETTEEETTEEKTTEEATTEAETSEVETTEIATTEPATTEEATTEAETLPEVPSRVERVDDLASPSDAYKKIISDQIPEGLDVTKVEVRVNTDEEDQWISLDSSHYNLEDGLLTYTIGTGPTELEAALNENSPVVETVDLKIHTRMNDALYNEYMMSGKTFERTFSNKAQLKDEDGSKTLTNTNRVEDKLSLEPFLRKKGEAVNIANGEFKWTLTVNSLFSDGQATLYAIDHIEDIGKTHNIIPDKKVKLNKGDGEPKEMNIHVINGINGIDTPPYTLEEATARGLVYEEMNITRILEFLDSEKIKPDHEEAIVYTYATATASNAAELEYDAIMLIPLSPNYTNGVTNIEYYTDATVGIPDGSGAGHELTLLNEAKMAWRWRDGGPGPGSGVDFGGATIEKNIDTYRHLVNKSAEDKGGVTDGTTITWNFEINQIGIPVKTLTVTDTVDTAIQQFVELGSDKTIELTAHIVDSSIPYNPEDLTARTASMSNAGKGDRYTLVEGVDAVGRQTQTFTLYLEDLKPNVYYTCSVETEVQESALNNHGEITIENAAVINATFESGPGVDDETKAKTKIKNPLINKKALNFNGGAGDYNYNYVDNTVKWKVEINSECRTITNAGIVDTLPDGVTLATISNATYGGEEAEKIEPTEGAENSWEITFAGGPIVTVKETPGTIKISDKEYAKNEVNFTFKPESESINEAFTVEYTTFVTDDYRRDIVKSNQKTTLTNKAKLEGSIGGVPINGEAKAVHRINPQPNKKSGQYHEADSTSEIAVTYLSWELYVNRTNADFEGGIVSDTLNEKQHLQLDPQSMKVYQVVLDEKGNEVVEKRGEAIAEFGDKAFTQCNDEGFVYVIPEKYKKATLLFTFDTILIDNANANEMTNEASIKTSGGTDSTGNIQAGGAKRFSLDSYAKAKGMFFIKVDKTTENKGNQQSFPLAGAEFKLTKLERRDGAQGTSIGDWEDATNPWSKTKVTNSDGSINFMFLQEGAMYRLEETIAPAGYVKLDRVWYVVPKDAGLDYPKEGVSEDGKIEVKRNSGENHFNSVTVKNDVIKAQNEIKFKKLGYGGQILPGVKFNLSHKDLNLREATSNDDGWVIFDKLDPLPKGERYTITEVQQTGYKKAPNLSGYVTYNDSTESFDVELKQGTTEVEKVTDAEGTYYVVRNEAPVGSGSFQKVDQNGDLITDSTTLNGITFNVERRGDGGQVLKDNGSVIIDVDHDSRMNAGDHKQSSTKYYTYEKNKQLTSVDGTFTFKDYPYGDYRFTEGIDSSMRDAFVSPDAGKVIDVRINQDGKTQVKIDENWTELGNNYKVTNDLKYGLIQINKVVGSVNANGTLTPVKDADGNNVPLADAVFKVYVDTDGKADGKAVLELVTDEDGHFTIDKDNKYLDHNDMPQDYRLIFGKKYLLKEIAAPEGYKLSDTLYPFDMTQIKATGDKIYIGANPADTQVNLGSDSITGDIVATLPNQNSDYIFPNGEAYRGTVNLKKYDTENNGIMLGGAVFDVFESRGDKIAKLTDTKTKKTYLLEPGGAGYVSDNHVGQSYLHLESDAYKLLPGSYYIVETKAPAGYLLPSAERWYFQIESVPNEKITNVDLLTQTTGGTVKPLENRIAKYDVAIQKYIQEALHESTYHTARSTDALAEIEFRLAGVTVNGEDYTDTKVLARDMNEQGIVTFANVPAGIYVVTELHVPEQYQVPAPVYVVVGANGVQINNSQMPVTAPIRVDNDLKRGAIQGKKHRTGGIALEGAVMGIFPAGTTEFTKENLYSGLTAVSDKEGNFRFEHILYGDYVIAELEAPSGYWLNTAVSYQVRIAESGNTVTTGDKQEHGVITVPGANIVIINEKKSPGGGGETVPPGGPGETPSVPEVPTSPSIPETSETPEVPTTPNRPELPTIPADPADPGRPNIPPGTDVEVHYPDDPYGPPLHEGPYDPNQNYEEIPPGVYELITIDDEGVPLAGFMFTIDENGVPLAMPKAGDSSVSTTILMVIFATSLMGIAIIRRRKKEDYE